MTSTEAVHTPGPWAMRHSRDGSGDVGITANGVSNVIAECFAAMRSHNENARQEAEANARLIAAAPEMLTALRRMVEIDDDSVVVDTASVKERLAEARGAIAKAEGRSAISKSQGA